MDVWLGPTHQNRGRQSSWSECLSRFCCGQIQPPEKQTQPVVGRKSSTFHLDCVQRPAWGWWWIRWQSGRTGPCLPSSRQSQHSPGVESSKSEKSGEKEFPTSSSADRSDGGAGARVDAAATSLPPSWRRSGSRGVVVGRRGPRVTGAKRSAMFFQRALTRPMLPKLAPRTLSKR